MRTHTDGIPYATKCEWIISPESEQIQFCGKSPQHRQSYCAEHYAKAYQVDRKSKFDKQVKKDLQQIEDNLSREDKE